MSQSLVLFAVGSLTLVACASRPVQTSDAPVVAPAARQVHQLRCRFAYFPLGAETATDSPQQPEQQTLVVQGDEQQAATLAGLRLSAAYAVGQAHRSGVRLEISADGTFLLGQTFQLPDTTLPTDLGGGFTGLISVRHPGHGGDYQYSCELLPRSARP